MTPKERRQHREAGTAYDYTDEKGVRYVWHPEAVEEVAEHLDRARARKSMARSYGSHTPAGYRSQP